MCWRSHKRVSRTGNPVLPLSRALLSSLQPDAAATPGLPQKPWVWIRCQHLQQTARITGECSILSEVHVRQPLPLRLLFISPFLGTWGMECKCSSSKWNRIVSLFRAEDGEDWGNKIPTKKTWEWASACSVKYLRHPPRPTPPRTTHLPAFLTVRPSLPRLPRHAVPRPHSG